VFWAELRMFMRPVNGNTLGAERKKSYRRRCAVFSETAVFTLREWRSSSVREARLVKKFWAYLKFGPHWRTDFWYSILGVYVASQLTHATIPALYPYFHPN